MRKAAARKKGTKMRMQRSADIPVRRNGEAQSVHARNSTEGFPELLRTGMSALRPHAAPSLRNDFGFWELTFGGQQAVLRCEPGAAYVAWLLANRSAQPIHALELAAAISGQACPCFGAREVFHPDKAAATLFWARKQKELEALVDSEDTLDPVKEEALRELEGIYAYQERNSFHALQGAEAAAGMVCDAIEKFYRNLAGALDLRGEPHQLARAFARYVEEHVLGPSRGAIGWGCRD